MELLDKNTANIQTFSDNDVISMGEFILGELEKLDQRRYGPLYTPTYKRDIKFRTDVTMYDTASSYVKYFFRAGNGVNGAKIADAVPEQNVSPDTDFVYKKYTQPLYNIKRSLSYDFFELKRSQILNRPIDAAKYDALMMAHDMEMERLVYVGNDTKGITGLLNDADAVASQTDLAVNWANAATKADDIVRDINNMFAAAWKRTAYNLLPKKMLMSPTLYAMLVDKKVSEAGNMSVLNYVKENSIVKNQLGVLPEILPLKWLEKGIPGAIENRIVVYENEEQFIRLPYVPLQRLFAPTLVDSSYKASYNGLYGGMEIVYPETLNYFKVKTA